MNRAKLRKRLLCVSAGVNVCLGILFFTLRNREPEAIPPNRTTQINEAQSSGAKATVNVAPAADMAYASDPLPSTGPLPERFVTQSIPAPHWVTLPADMSKIFVDIDIKRLLSHGIMFRVVELVSMTPEEKRRLEDGIQSVAAEAKEMEKRRTRLVRDDPTNTYISIDYGKDWSSELQASFAELFVSVLGDERGELLASILRHHESKENVVDRRELSMELSPEGEPMFVERVIRAGSTRAPGTGSELTTQSLTRLERRYGHVFDFAPWFEFVKERDAAEAIAADPANPAEEEVGPFDSISLFGSGPEQGTEPTTPPTP